MLSFDDRHKIPNSQIFGRIRNLRPDKYNKQFNSAYRPKHKDHSNPTESSTPVELHPSPSRNRRTLFQSLQLATPLRVKHEFDLRASKNSASCQTRYELSSKSEAQEP
jgi:hypothetical protein